MMIIEKIPGFETKEDIIKEMKNLSEAAYWERRMGRIRASDLFEDTINALSQTKIKE